MALTSSETAMLVGQLVEKFSNCGLKVGRIVCEKMLLILR